MKNLQKFSALLLALIMVFSLSATVFAADSLYADVTLITGADKAVNTVEGSGTQTVTVTFKELNLTYSPIDATNGRNQVACWAGITVTAPEGFVADSAKYRTTGSSDWTNFKDVKDGDNYVTLWYPITAAWLQQWLENGRDYLYWGKEFDWDGDGNVDQYINVKVIPSESIVLNVNPDITDDANVAWPTSTEYAITISGAQVGETYKAYKIFDTTYSDTDNNGTIETGEAIAYTISTSSPWFTDIQTYANTTDSGLILTKSAGDDTVYVVTTDETQFSAPSFAAYLATKVSGKPVAGAVVATAGETAIHVAEAGYYFVDTSLGALCSLDTTTPNVTIYEKNSVPSITKVVENDASDDGTTEAAYGESAVLDVIDTVKYKLTVNTGNNTYDQNSTDTGVDGDYIITDTLPTGFTFNAGSVGVAVDNAAWTDADYTVNYTGQVLTITLKSEKLKTLEKQTNITITYTATISKIDDVVGTTGNINLVTLTYKSQTSQDQATVYTYAIGGTAEAGTTPPFQKVDGDTNKPLQGVEFILSKTVGTGDAAATKYATLDADGFLTNWDATKETATAIVTDENGAIVVKGLDAGTYILTETKTLDGYNLLTDTITVVIDENGNVTYEMTNDTTDRAAPTITVKNNTGSLLPSTGGIGTTIFYVLGSILVLGAAVLLITKKRMTNA